MSYFPGISEEDVCHVLIRQTNRASVADSIISLDVLYDVVDQSHECVQHLDGKAVLQFPNLFVSMKDTNIAVHQDFGRKGAQILPQTGCLAGNVLLSLGELKVDAAELI